jgi:hypothetical protein
VRRVNAKSCDALHLLLGMMVIIQGCGVHHQALSGRVGENPATGTKAVSACENGQLSPEEGWPSELHWCSSRPLVAPIPTTDHAILSVKDPSVVYYDERWHLFATTADDQGRWSMVYSSFADWKDAAAAPQFYLNENPSLSGYHCAPQVFFFAPQKKWYLIFQSGQPQYSTNDDISRPEAWSKPVDFFASEPETVKTHKGSGGWLDFWIICDDARCHLFFTDDNGALYRSETNIADFPRGFGEPVVAIQGTKETLFEGSSTYYVEETKGYLTLVEAFGEGGRRFYRSYVSDKLDGQWTPWLGTWEKPFAALSNVTFAAGSAWSDQVSHGELLRKGYDQTPRVSLRELRFLYQGLAPDQNTPDYFRLPYRLGLLTRTAAP